MNEKMNGLTLTHSLLGRFITDVTVWATKIVHTNHSYNSADVATNSIQVLLLNCLITLVSMDCVRFAAMACQLLPYSLFSNPLQSPRSHMLFQLGGFFVMRLNNRWLSYTTVKITIVSNTSYREILVTNISNIDNIHPGTNHPSQGQLS